MFLGNKTDLMSWSSTTLHGYSSTDKNSVLNVEADTNMDTLTSIPSSSSWILFK